MNATTPIEVLRLENGLVLEIYDASKKLVGDRWTVVLLARVEIEVANSQAAAELGDRVTYEQKRERVFVDNGDKGTVFGELRTSFLRSQQAYLSRQDFAERFVQRQLAVLRQKPRP